MRNGRAFAGVRSGDSCTMSPGRRPRLSASCREMRMPAAGPACAASELTAVAAARTTTQSRNARRRFIPQSTIGQPRTDTSVEPTMRTMTVIAAVLLLLALACVALFWAGQRRLIYYPDGEVQPADSVGLSGAQDVSMALEDGGAIAGWFVPAAEPRFTVIVFNGN